MNAVGLRWDRRNDHEEMKLAGETAKKECGFLVEARKQDGSFLGLQLPIGRFELTGNGT